MARTRKNRPRACRARKKRKIRPKETLGEGPAQHKTPAPKPPAKPSAPERAYRARRYTVHPRDLTVLHDGAYDSAYRRHLHRAFMHNRVPGKSIRHFDINPDLYHSYFSTEVYFECTRKTYNGTVETIRYGSENVYTM